MALWSRTRAGVSVGCMQRALTSKVARVPAATRGAGRRIVNALGETGATVQCTIRSTLAARSECDRPETIEKTA